MTSPSTQASSATPLSANEIASMQKLALYTKPDSSWVYTISSRTGGSLCRKGLATRQFVEAEGAWKYRITRAGQIEFPNQTHAPRKRR